MVADELLPASIVVQVVEQTEGFVVGTTGRVVILRTRKPFESEAAVALFRATTAAMLEYGPHVLYVIMPGAAEPSVNEEAAARIASLWPKIQAQSAAGVVWLRSRGFTTVLHRNQLAELLPWVRNRSLLGVTESAADTVQYFSDNVADFGGGLESWTSALETFGRRFD